MCAKIKSLPQKTVVRESCCHHWVIEYPSTRTSKGICRLCGCEREFFNSFDDLRSAAFKKQELKSE